MPIPCSRSLTSTHAIGLPSSLKAKSSLDHSIDQMYTIFSHRLLPTLMPLTFTPFLSQTGDVFLIMCLLSLIYYSCLLPKDPTMDDNLITMCWMKDMKSKNCPLQITIWLTHTIFYEWGLYVYMCGSPKKLLIEAIISSQWKWRSRFNLLNMHILYPVCMLILYVIDSKGGISTLMFLLWICYGVHGRSFVSPHMLQCWQLSRQLRSSWYGANILKLEDISKHAPLLIGNIIVGWETLVQSKAHKPVDAILEVRMWTWIWWLERATSKPQNAMSLYIFHPPINMSLEGSKSC